MAFNGDKKKLRTPLTPIEKKVVTFLIPYVPSWIHSSWLTLLTIVWSGLVLLFSFLANKDSEWLWLVSLVVLLQYLTDSLDGALGRYRDAGLARWGFYMDHFLDYIFLCCILIGYSFLVPLQNQWIFFYILAIFGAFMVHAFLGFSATNEFKVSYFFVGPSEVKIGFIIINVLLIVLDKTLLVTIVPYVLAGSFLVLIAIVYRMHKQVLAIDMEEKQKRKTN